ncbi:peptidoglycan-binding protein [Tessaracoccus sp. OH4464_COT-324]|uniref:peptidoglycan-binding protein n=1 Tax=Tessaracoccus sp. OH4464_COT-324 TaxID=2491059 RepID=UPI000F63585A|nr:peptidoglycan-binding protein [Tessaracoccus sp. OH4464_COT-324]RRD46012.1 peptidoglycan-binding protein [Tessaracoccus sp. OH4464_COT-324]
MPSRRLLFAGLASGSLVALAGGCARGRSSPPADADGCRAPGELVEFSSVAGARLYYAESGKPVVQRIQPAFLAQLEAWALDWAEVSGYGPVLEITSFGAFVDKCGSFHQLGRAFDLAQIRQEEAAVSARFDEWQPGRSQQLRDYWRLAASLQLHFNYTLCYPYNDAHLNHIHVDNSISGSDFSEFNQNSRVQVQLVQHTLRHVFDLPTPDTGVFDDVTRDALRQVQAAAGIHAPLRNAAGWHAYLRAAARG